MKFLLTVLKKILNFWQILIIYRFILNLAIQIMDFHVANLDELQDLYLLGNNGYKVF